MKNETQLEVVADQITEALALCKAEDIRELPAMKQAIALAKGMGTLRAALTETVVRELFMPLQGSALGFRTDRDNLEGDQKGYAWFIVRDAVIEALVRGFQVVGNEFNIISGRAYFTKEGMTRRVDEFPELTEFESSASVPVMSGDKGALVAYRASWRLKGKPMILVRDLIEIEGRKLDERIAVRVNSGMGIDAILGKAKRKFYALLLEKLMGARMGFMDGDVGDTIETTGETVVSGQKPATAARVDELVNKRREDRSKAKEAPVEELTEAQKLAREAAEFEKAEAAKNA